MKVHECSSGVLKGQSKHLDDTERQNSKSLFIDLHLNQYKRIILITSQFYCSMI